MRTTSEPSLGWQTQAEAHVARSWFSKRCTSQPSVALRSNLGVRGLPPAANGGTA